MIGAPRPLPLAKPAAIDTAQAARYFGARGEPDEKTMALLETCALPLLAAATPRAVWLEADTAALAEAGILRCKSLWTSSRPDMPLLCPVFRATKALRRAVFEAITHK